MRPLPLFLLGVAVSATATHFLTRPTSTPDLLTPRSSLLAPSSSPTLPAWSWRDSPTPPSLARDTVGPTIAAWIAERGPDGGPAPYATRVAGLRALLVRLPVEGFPRLLDALVASSAPDDKRLCGLAFEAWLLVAPESAAPWALAKGADSRDFIRQAVAAWAARDALAAATWACAVPDDKAAREIAGGALAALARKDPARAIALAGSRDDAFRVAVFASLLGPLGQTDPAGTVRTYAPELWKNGQGFWALRETLTAWTKKDPDAAIAWLLMQPRTHAYELSNWFSNLGHNQNDPAWRRTLADAVVHAPITNRVDTLSNLFFDWNGRNPAEALAWLNALPDPELRLALLERTASSYLTDNPEKSLPLALALPEGSNRSRQLSNLLGAWAKIDASAALAWVDAHATEPGVATASYSVNAALLATIARDEPATAIAEWQNLTDPQAKAAAIGPIVQAWGKTDPAAALQWESAQNDGRTYSNVNSDLIYAWGQKDPEAALRWAETQTAAQQAQGRRFHPTPIAAIAGTWQERAPRATTADLFTKIQDPKLRSETLGNHVREWLTKDPAGAKAWLESSKALTPAETAALLAR